MRMMLRGFRRFAWIALVLGAAASLVAGALESRSRSARYTATARVVGLHAGEVLQASDLHAKAAVWMAVPDRPPGFWRDEAALRKALLTTGTPEAARPDVRIEGNEISASSSDPAQARLAADALAAAAVLAGRDRRRAAAKRIEDLRAELAAAEALAVPRDEAAREIERQLAVLQGSEDAVDLQMKDLLIRQDRAVARLRWLEAEDHRFRGAFPSESEDPTLTSAVYQRLSLEWEEILGRRAKLLSTDPEFARLSARLDELDKAKARELSIIRDKAVVSLKRDLDGMEGEKRILQEARLRKALEVRELAVELRYLTSGRGDVDRLRADLVRATSDAAGLGGDVSMEESSTPAKSGGVRARVPWVAGVAGALAGLLAAALLQALDRRIRTADDVKRRLGLPVIGLARAVKDDPLIVTADPGSSAASDYSLAAGVLRGYLSEREYRTVLVTGAGAGEGKSTAAANLAVAFARKGLSVALVDADLRAPRQAAIFGLDDSQGLSTLLTGGELEVELPAGATELPLLKVLVAGPVSDASTELLEFPRMGEILQALRGRYDVVVIDGPPLGAGGDAVALARLADTVAWVLRAGRQTAERVGWTRHLLKNVGADVAGILLVGAAEGAGMREYTYPSANEVLAN